MSTVLRISAITLAGIGMAACSGTSEFRCEQPQVHDNARMIGGLSAPAELQVPPSDPALEIPFASGVEDRPHIRKRADGSCLQAPPPFIEPIDG